MKRYLFILLLIVSLGILAAVESGPSETVGYFKHNILTNGWHPLSLPFNYADLTPGAVLGTQFGDMDTVFDLNGDASFYLAPDWLGSIAEMTYGHAYWMSRDVANPTFDYYLLGKVDPATLVIHVKGLDDGGWSSFSLNEARSIPLTTAGLFAGVQENDTIFDLNGDASFYMAPDWLGSLVSIEPTHGYWYQSMSATSYDWTYTPVIPGRNVTTPVVEPSTSKVKK